jgi:organic hydroperoxide reductase OsmC/OhrA
MTLCAATIAWRRDAGAAFTDSRYSRAHLWRFDGGAELAASSSPHIVPLPMSDPAGVDPEEAFVASLASCHMLWFLSLAAEQGWRVDAYDDAASGVLGRNARGKLAMTVVTLRPHVVFGGELQPSRDEIDAVHQRAHEACFIANSVLTEVRCEPVHDCPQDAFGVAPSGGSAVGLGAAGRRSRQP